MILKRLKLVNWRNYDSLEITPPPGLVLISGDNGEGKTNIAEAINYLSLAKSWRSDESKALIKEGSATAFIEAEIEENGMNRLIQISLNSGKNGKKASLNGKTIRKLSELLRVANVILFEPSDATIFTGAPSKRRSFLDVSISKISTDYLNTISKYNRLLDERNALLKTQNPNLDYIDVLTSRMIEEAKTIIGYRSTYINELNRSMLLLIPELYGGKATAKLVYRPFVSLSENFIEEAKKAFSKAFPSDLIHKSTSVGPHREDFTFLLGGKDISLYGSRGENRLGAIALKLSPYFLIEDEGRKPIAVLDDIYSELDDDHAKRLTNLLLKMGQVFVTDAKIEIKEASNFEVSKNKAIRRK